MRVLTIPTLSITAFGALKNVITETSRGNLIGYYPLINDTAADGSGQDGVVNGKVVQTNIGWNNAGGMAFYGTGMLATDVAIGYEVRRGQALNAFVPRIEYTPQRDWTGSDDLVVEFYRMGRSDLKTTTRIEIIVNPVNDPPYFESLPASFNPNLDSNVLLTGIRVADIDALDRSVELKFSCVAGEFVFLSNPYWIQISISESGQKSNSMKQFKAIGSIDGLNQALEILAYRCLEYTQDDLIKLSLSDLGNSGSGKISVKDEGHVTASTETWLIHVTAVNDPPTVSVSEECTANGILMSVQGGRLITDEDVSASMDGVSFSFSAGEKCSVSKDSEQFRVNVSARIGSIVNSETNSNLDVSLVDDKTSNSVIVESGSWLSLVNALGGLFYVPFPNWNSEISRARDEIQFSITRRPTSGDTIYSPAIRTVQVLVELVFRVLVEADGEDRCISDQVSYFIPVKVTPVDQVPQLVTPKRELHGEYQITSTFEDTAVSIADIRVESVNLDRLIHLLLVVGHGTLQMNDDDAVHQSKSKNESMICLEGTLASVNRALTTLTYMPDPNFNGIWSGQNGNVISRLEREVLWIYGAYQDVNKFQPSSYRTVEQVRISVEPVDEAPEVLVPSSFDIYDKSCSKLKITTTDFDLIDLLSVSVSVDSGYLGFALVSALGPLRFSEGSLLEDVEDRTSWAFEGTENGINSALASMYYCPREDFAGQDTLNITVGHVGSDSSHSTQKIVPIFVMNVVKDPVIQMSDTAVFTLSEDESTFLPGLEFKTDPGETRDQFFLKITAGNGFIGVDALGSGVAYLDSSTTFELLEIVIEDAIQGTFQLCLDSSCAQRTVDLTFDVARADLETVLNALILSTTGVSESVSVQSTGMSKWIIRPRSKAGLSCITSLHLDVKDLLLSIRRFAHEISIYGTTSALQAATKTLKYISLEDWNSLQNGRVQAARTVYELSSATVVSAHVHVDPVNDAPEIFTPSIISVFEDERQLINTIRVQDIDVDESVHGLTENAGTVELKISTKYGSVAMLTSQQRSIDGVRFIQGELDMFTKEIVLSGNLANVNRALETFHYRSTSNWNSLESAAAQYAVSVMQSNVVTNIEEQHVFTNVESGSIEGNLKLELDLRPFYSSFSNRYFENENQAICVSSEIDYNADKTDFEGILREMECWKGKDGLASHNIYPEIQSIDVFAKTTDVRTDQGFFSLYFGDESSDRISFEADETSVGAILEKITGISGVDVSRTVLSSGSSTGIFYSWTITFPLVAGNVPQLLISENSMHESLGLTIQTLQEGGSDDPFPFLVIQVDGGQKPDHDMDLHGAFHWQVTFLNAPIGLPLLTVHSNSLTITLASAKVPSVVVERHRIGSQDISGHFRLEYGGFSTLRLPYDVDGESLSREFAKLNVIRDGSVSVVRKSNEGPFTWTLSYLPVNIESTSVVKVDTTEFNGILEVMAVQNARLNLDESDIQVNDLGNIGDGIDDTGLATIYVDVLPVDDPVSIQCESIIFDLDEDTLQIVSGVSIDGSDKSISFDSTLIMKFECSNGRLQLFQDVTFAMSFKNGRELYLVESLNQINEAIRDFTYHPNNNFNGVDFVDITVAQVEPGVSLSADELSDRLKTATITSTVQLTMHILALNDPSVIQIPSFLAVDCDRWNSIGDLISIQDPDIRENPKGMLGLEISCSGGNLLFVSPQRHYVHYMHGEGDGRDQMLMVEASLENIQAAIATLSYHPDTTQQDDTFQRKLDIRVYDGGWSGSGGNLTVLSSMDLMLKDTVYRQPGIQLPMPTSQLSTIHSDIWTLPEDTALEIKGTTVNPSKFAANSERMAFAVAEIECKHGVLSFIDSQVHYLTGSRTGISSSSFIGSSEATSKALDSIAYVPRQNFNGVDEITFVRYKVFESSEDKAHRLADAIHVDSYDADLELKLMTRSGTVRLHDFIPGIGYSEDAESKNLVLIGRPSSLNDALSVNVYTSATGAIQKDSMESEMSEIGCSSQMPKANRTIHVQIDITGVNGPPKILSVGSVTQLKSTSIGSALQYHIHHIVLEDDDAQPDDLMQITLSTSTGAIKLGNSFDQDLAQTNPTLIFYATLKYANWALPSEIVPLLQASSDLLFPKRSVSIEAKPRYLTSNDNDAHVAIKRLKTGSGRPKVVELDVLTTKHIDTRYSIETPATSPLSGSFKVVMDLSEMGFGIIETKDISFDAVAMRKDEDISQHLGGMTGESVQSKLEEVIPIPDLQIHVDRVPNGGSSPSYLCNVKSMIYFAATGLDTSWMQPAAHKDACGSQRKTVVNDVEVLSVVSESNTWNMDDLFDCPSGYHWAVGRELWRSDGTKAGTVLLQDIWIGSQSSDPQDLESHSDGLVDFSATSLIGRELWATDGVSVSDQQVGENYGTFNILDICAGTGSSNPKNLVSTSIDGGTIFFQADDCIHGSELWKTDGSSSGTVMVKDINPTAGLGSNPSYIVEFNDNIYFQAVDGVHGEELWQSDGTQVGTILLIDILRGSQGSKPSHLNIVIPPTHSDTPNSPVLLFFANSDEKEHAEMWISDGTAIGTDRAYVSTSKSVFLDTAESQLFTWGNSLIYSAIGRLNQPSVDVPSDYDAPLYEVEIAVNDGSVSLATPAQMSFINGSGENDCYVKVNSTLSALNQALEQLRFTPTLNWNSELGRRVAKITFTIRDGDGLQTSTTANIFVESVEDEPVILIPGAILDERNYRPDHASPAILGVTPYEVDEDVPTRVMEVFIRDVDVDDNTLGTGFFNAQHHSMLSLVVSVEHGTVSLPSGSGETLMGSSISLLATMRHMNSALEYLIYTSEIDYKKDRLYLLPRLVLNDPDVDLTLRMSISVSHVTMSLNFGQESQSELEYIAGTGKDDSFVIVEAPILESDFTEMEFAGIVCVLGDGQHVESEEYKEEEAVVDCRDIGDVCRIGAGSELWATDGTIQGTFRVADINPGLVGSHPKFIVQYNTVILFQATTAEHRTELWRSDGTLERTKLVEDIVRGVGSSTPQYLLSFNGFVCFASSNPKYLVKTTTCMYFQANDGIHGTELWRSDGSPSGTYLLKDIKPGPESSNPSYLIEYYFQADDGLYGAELWVTDGTFANTYRLKVGSGGSHPAYLTRFTPGWRSTVFHPWKLYFTANTEVYGRTQIWISDGTSAGTYRALSDSGPRDIDIDNIALDRMMPASMGELSHTLYFPAREGDDYVVDLETLVVSQAIVIGDVDCSSELLIYMEMKCSKGRFTIDVFSGTLPQVNLALRQLIYKPNRSEYGYDTLVVYANDTAASDTDGFSFMATQNIDITIEALNNPPEIHLERPSFKLAVDERVGISGLSMEMIAVVVGECLLSFRHKRLVHDPGG